jgi:hypothetical protein
MTTSTQALQSYAAPTAIDATTPGMNNLGCGINAATGSYLVAYTEQIVDIDKLVECVQMVDLNTFTSESITAQDSYSYLTQQTADTGISGGYAGFAASVSTSFSETVTTEGTNSLATYTQITQLYQLTIPVADRPKILTAGFSHDLYNMEPQEFYSKYGAYFTSEVIVGGSMSSSVQTAATQTYDQATLAASAEASFNDGVSSGKLDSSYTYTNSNTKTTYSCNNGIVMVGGDLSLPLLPDGAIDVDGWKQTIPSTPQVVGWNSLTPMWELITDNEQRQSELQGAIDAYFSAPNSYLLAPLTLKHFTASSDAGTGPESQEVTVDPGYKILCGGASLAQDGNNNQFLNTSNVLVSDTPNQWAATAKSVHNSTKATLTTHAIAVYDPNDLLDIQVFETISSGNVEHPQAKVTIGSSYVMVGGGATTTPTNTNGLMLTASYPDSNTSWTGIAKDHENACPGTITVCAIGIKWRNPNGKPTLSMEIVSNQSALSNAPTQTAGAGGYFTLVGGGAFDNYGSGYGNMLQDSYPVYTSDKPPVWKATGHDCKESDNSILTVYAIGLQVVWTSSDNKETKVAFGPGCLTPPVG